MSQGSILNNFWLQLFTIIGSILVIPWFLLEVSKSLYHFLTSARLTVTVLSGTTTIHSLPERKRFGWKLKNKGGNKANEISIGMRFPPVGSGILVSGFSLAQNHDIDVFYGLITPADSTDRPEFEFVCYRNPFVEEPESLAVIRGVRLDWDTTYKIELDCHYQGSGTELRRFNLELGSSRDKSIRLSETHSGISGRVRSLISRFRRKK